MNESELNKLKEASCRRRLTTEEEMRLQTFFATSPRAQSEWETEFALNETLRQLPNAPLASNFTARVLQAVQREHSRAPKSFWARWPRGWLPRLSFATVLVSIGIFSLQEYRLSRRTEMATSLEKVSQVAALPKLEWLQDFDAINRLNRAPVGDNDLLAALDTK